MRCGRAQVCGEGVQGCAGRGGGGEGVKLASRGDRSMF